MNVILLLDPFHHQLAALLGQHLGLVWDMTQHLALLFHVHGNLEGRVDNAIPSQDLPCKQGRAGVEEEENNSEV